MAKTTSVLAATVGPSDLAVGFGAAGVDNNKIRAGDNITVGNESMKALAVDPLLGATIVYRGTRGTALGTGAAYAAGQVASFGQPSDFAATVGPGGPGVAMAPLEFQEEAAAEIKDEDAEKLAERVEKKRKELVAKAAEKAAADAKAAEAAEKAAEKAEAKGERNDRPSAHR
jgi:hypothetical protein